MPFHSQVLFLFAPSEIRHCASSCTWNDMVCRVMVHHPLIVVTKRLSAHWHLCTRVRCYAMLCKIDITQISDMHFSLQSLCSPRYANDPRYAKPPASYAALITTAIRSSKEQKLTLNDIYKWIMVAYPYYSVGPPGWKVCFWLCMRARERVCGSVRGNLCAL